MAGENISLPALVKELSPILDRPVLDRTGSRGVIFQQYLRLTSFFRSSEFIQQHKRKAELLRQLPSPALL